MKIEESGMCTKTEIKSWERTINTSKKTKGSAWKSLAIFRI